MAPSTDSRSRRGLIEGGIARFPEGYSLDRQIGWFSQKHNRDASRSLQGSQVQSFIALDTCHRYIAEARREVEQIIGTKLCLEHCCCARAVPFVSRLEAEYIISCTGYYSELTRIAEEWVLTEHPEAPSYPRDLPAVVGGTSLRQLDVAGNARIAMEYRVLAATPSPYLRDNRGHRNRLLSGRWFSSGRPGNDEALDLLGNAQPLTCAVSGVFTASPPWCQRPLGRGESGDARVLADPTSLKRYYQLLLDGTYREYPDKARFGLLPTMIYRVADPAGFERNARDGKIALAKLGIGKGPPPIKLWEDEYVGTVERPPTISAAGSTGGTRGRPLI